MRWRQLALLPLLSGCSSIYVGVEAGPVIDSENYVGSGTPAQIYLEGTAHFEHNIDVTAKLIHQSDLISSSSEARGGETEINALMVGVRLKLK